MNEDFVTFELAKKLQEKGCSVKCLAFYTNVGILHCNESLGPHETYMDLLEMNNNQRGRGIIYDAPTISQVLKWLRENRFILVINPTLFNADGICVGWQCEVWADDNYDSLSKEHKTYEAAALAGIEYCLDNLI